LKSKRIWAILMVVALLAVTLTGCGEETKKANNPEGEKTETENKIDDEQYITTTTLEPQAIDPSKSSDVYSSQILNEITEGLARIEVDEKGTDVYKPAGAEKWDVSDDGLVWTFHLRDYKWSDGKTVTAKDFEYGIKRTIDPKVASNYAFLLYPIKNAQVCNTGEKPLDELGVKTVDDKTLEITLEGPCAYFEKLLAFKTMYPQRQDLVEKWGDKSGTEAEYTISCGPFELSEWTHKNQLVLTKNENYWDKDNVKLDKLTYKVATDPTTRANMLSSGQLDMAGITQSEWVEKFKKDENLNYTSRFRATTAYQFYNQEDKLFSNANIRKAFSLAMDREEMVDVLYYGIAGPAYGFVPPDMTIGDKQYREVVEEPLKKLKEENPDPKALFIKGLEELGMDPDPSKVTVTMLQSGTDANTRRFAEYDQQVYEKKLGINVKAEYVDWPVFLDRTDKKEYQVGGMAWTGDYNDPMTFLDMWVTDAGMSNVSWSNKEYDDLIKKAQKSLDDEERLECFKRAEEILLCDDTVISPTVYMKNSTFMYKYVKGTMSPLFGSGMEFKYAYTQGRGK